MGKALTIAIVGAGIGGLVTALVLHRQGHRVRLYEAARELRPLGVGINLLPQAVAHLEALGRTTQGWTIRIIDEADRLVCLSRFTVAVIPTARA